MCTVFLYFWHLAYYLTCRVMCIKVNRLNIKFRIEPILHWKLHSEWLWLSTPAIPALQSLTQKDVNFKASLGLLRRPCFRNKQTTKPLQIIHGAVTAKRFARSAGTKMNKISPITATTTFVSRPLPLPCLPSSPPPLCSASSSGLQSKEAGLERKSSMS